MTRIQCYTLLTLLISSSLLMSCDKNADEAKPVVVDIDGNVYETAIIGNQIWMAENLKTTKFNDGEEITYVAEEWQWFTLEHAGMCWYENNPEFCELNKSGALYNWYTVEDDRLCPKGWHVPAKEEWDELIDYVGIDDAATLLKHIDGWPIGEGGTNQYSFNALPSGSRTGYAGGDFMFTGKNVSYWSSTKVEDKGEPDKRYDFAWRLSIDGSGYPIFNTDTWSVGLNVRCVKNRGE